MLPSARARLLRHPAVIAGAVLALGASAFVGYGAWTRHGDVRYARGGAEFGVEAVQATPSAAPVPGGIATPGRAKPTPAPAAEPAGPGSTLTSNLTQHHLIPTQIPSTSAPGPALPGPPGRLSVAAPTPVAAAAAPVTGRYALAVEGSENVKFGPLSFCGRDFPVASELVVTPAQGEPAGSYNFDVRYYPGDAGRHDERQIYRYTRDGVEQGFEGATVECGGVRQSSDVAYAPVKSRVRLPLAVGQKWSGEGGDDGRTETYRTAVTGTDSVTIAGRNVAVYLIETETAFTGAEVGTRSQRWWYAPAYAMPLRWTDRTQGSRSGATYTSELTVSVTSLPTGEEK